MEIVCIHGILRKDLFEVMTKASAMGFPWGMVSNGSLIDKCTIQKMKQSGMKTISISLDGMADFIYLPL